MLVVAEDKAGVVMSDRDLLPRSGACALRASGRDEAVQYLSAG
jgi:hypothetical protein